MKNIFSTTGLLKWCVGVFVLLLSVAGRAQNDTVLYYNFGSACAAPPSGWSIQNVDGGCTWRCNGGIMQNNHTSQGCAGAADDWLITPQLDFDQFINEYINLTFSVGFSGGGLDVKYSANYPGSGNPNSYTWTDIANYNGGSGGTLNINSYSGKGYLALRYWSSGNQTNQAASYTVLNFGVFGTKALYATNPTVTNITDNSAKLGATVVNGGYGTIQGRGIVWSLTPNPLRGGSGVTDIATGTAAGVFDSTISSLPAGTKIYFKGYVRDSVKAYYTSETVFYTLSTEPTAYPSSFTATAISKNSIRLKWDSVPGAKGYVILQRVAQAPTGLPADANKYTVNQALGDGTVGAILTLGTDSTVIINGLIQGTRYYFTLFPYNYNLVNNETYNYRTATPVPTATDSTLGYPPSRQSTLENVTGNGDSLVMSIENDATVNDTTKGALVWKLKLMDGGIALNDSDDLPTIITSMILRPATGNTVINYITAMQSIGLFDDSTGTLLSQGTIAATTITFPSFTLKAEDNNYKTVSVRLSLRAAAQPDRARFAFKVDYADVVSKTVFESSQLKPFSAFSDTTKARIEVLATKLTYNTAVATPVEAGTTIIQQRVTASDVYGATDVDFNGLINLVSPANNIIGGNRTVNAVAGIANFDTIRFSKLSASDTLVATFTGLTEARSNRFVVDNSKRSDIVADANFVYPVNIKHLNYNTTDTITTANSLEVFSMYLRDGGATGDPDNDSTKLNSIIFSVANPYLIRRIALFEGTRKLGEVSNITASVTFSNFVATARDNDSTRLSVRVTFKDSAVDGHRLQFTVTSTGVVAPATSAMAAANAGGAISSAFLDNNKIDVSATMLVFVKQPVNVAHGAIQYPYTTVKAVDKVGNIDRSGRAITVAPISSQLNFMANKAAGVNPITGVAEYTKLIFDVPNTGVKLVARSAGLDSAVSDTFNVLLPFWFRSVKSGNWSALSTWEMTTDFGGTWVPATVIPNASIHGQITIRNGHTVQMDMLNQAANTVDELTIEVGAVLATPAVGSLELAVNDAFGDDIVVEGKLLHNNAQSNLDITAPAAILVKTGGMIELASAGNAADWAGNSNIWFEDKAVYLHNTATPNSISAGIMFPNATTGVVPVFRIADNTIYPGSLVNPYQTLAINGLVSIDSNKTFTIGGNGNRNIRNGIIGKGNVLVTDTANVNITGEAELSGTGKIQVNKATALFQIAAGSYTNLLNDKEISTTANRGITVAGTLNGHTNGFTGNGTTTILTDATIITAHTQGVDGLFANTGAKNYSPVANYEFNGTTIQNSGTIAGNIASTVTVSNPTDLTLTGAVTVTDTLFMGAGKVSTNTANLLTIAGNGVISGYTSSAYINGPVKMWVDSTETIEFPTGKTIYAPVAYTAISGGNWITLEYIANTPHANGFDTTKRGEGLASIRAKEYWAINASNKIDGNVKISYTANSDVTGADSLNIRIVSWNGTKWMSEGPVKRTASSTSVTSDILNNYTVFSIGVDSACTMPLAPTFTKLNVCSGKDAMLAASGTGTIRWFAGMNDTKPFAQGSIANAGAILADSVFYAEVKNIGCISPRVVYPVTINAIPAMPTVTGNTQLCYNQIAQLTADSAGTHNWFAAETATAPLFTGDNYTSAGLTRDSSFYVEKVQNGCASPRTKVDVIVRALVQNPFSTGAEVCSGNVAVVKATANEDIRWYRDAVATVPFFTGEKYTTVTLFGDTTFYLQAFDGACVSQRVPVMVDMLVLPATPVLTQPSVCAGNAAQITATSANKVYWYNDNISTISVDSGNVFNTANLLTSRTYFANVFDGKCWSPRVSSAVSVYEVPSNVAFTVANKVPTNQFTAVQTTTISQNYEWNFGADAIPQTAVGIGPHNVKWTTQGSKTVRMKVWNGNSAVACSTEVTNTLSVGPGLGVNEVSANAVTVYPNPVNSGELNIVLNDNHGADITVTDMTGKLVWKGSTNENHTTVNVDGWAAGVYFINISGTFNQTIKVTKQ